jgi:hypothetical protein
MRGRGVRRDGEAAIGSRGFPVRALLCEKYHKLGRFAFRDKSSTGLAGKASRVPLSGSEKARSGPANKNIEYRHVGENRL